MEPLTARTQAVEALKKAEEAERNSEYPRLGKAAYTELSQAFTQLAETLEAPATLPKADNAYELKKARRIDRLRRKAAYCRVEAAQAECKSHDIGRNIPFGQPILVGHHSERGHRNAIEKMRRAHSRASALLKMAEAADNSADAAEKGNAISSDDPQAVEKLKQKLTAMEHQRDQYKEINKLVRRNDTEGLKVLGLSEQEIHKLFNPQFSYQGQGVPAWRLTNIGANIRRVKERIEQLSKDVPTEEKVGFSGPGFELFEDAAENRVCFQFEGKPEERIRTALKSRGFKWSPSRGLWVRMLNNAARYAAKAVVQEISK